MPLVMLVLYQKRAHVPLYRVVSDVILLQLPLEQLLLSWRQLAQRILFLLLQ